MSVNKFEKNDNLLKQAVKVTPIGSQTYSKSYRYFCEGISPSFIEKGEGAYLWDVDGNKFLDFVCALGPITIGYNDKGINEAIIKQLDKGIIFSQPAEVSVRLAQKLVEIIPCAEMVRFVKNGSDATSSAVRLARAFTGKEIILASGYHGMQDWYIGSTKNNKGIPKAVCELTKAFDYNNLENLEALLIEHKDQVAAVILEPIQGNGPNEGYLAAVKDLAHKHGALLIFDEVVSGFRYALGGAQELYNVRPDLVAFGKGMANGMPISAVAGKREILELIGTEGVFISTTFGGETLSMVAALETISRLESKESYKHIWELGEMMLSGIKNLIDQYELHGVVESFGLAPHCGVVFEGAGQLDYLEISSIFQQRMVQESILTVGINNINLSHTKEDIQLYLNAVDLAFKDIRGAIQEGTVANIMKGKLINPIFKRN